MALQKPIKKASSGCCTGKADLSKMIQDRAYYIWESKGKPAGKDKDIWLQAEKEIKAKCK
jgi:hypothetical protein